MRAVVLLSGGLDSATAAAMARAQGYELYALTISYGQRHAREVAAARAVAAALGVREHKCVDITLREIGGSALTADIPLPLGRSEAEMSHGIPITYVPARNTIFLAIALGYAEVMGAETIVLGVNQVDYSGYPDCRQEFLDAFQHLANLATKAGRGGHQPFPRLGAAGAYEQSGDHPRRPGAGRGLRAHLELLHRRRTRLRPMR